MACAFRVRVVKRGRGFYWRHSLDLRPRLNSGAYFTPAIVRIFFCPINQSQHEEDGGPDIGFAQSGCGGLCLRSFQKRPGRGEWGMTSARWAGSCSLDPPIRSSNQSAKKRTASRLIRSGLPVKKRRMSGRGEAEGFGLSASLAQEPAAASKETMVSKAIEPLGEFGPA